MSDETFLEAFIESLSTLPHELKRNLELMKDLDKSLLSKSDLMRQLQQEFINRTEERVLQLKVVMDEKGSAADGQPIGLQVPNNTATASYTTTTNNNDDAMDVVVMEQEESSKKRSGNKKKSAKVTKRQREKEKNDAAAAAAAAAKDKDNNDNEDIRIPTTEELWDYATGRVDISNNNNSSHSTESSSNQQQQQQYHQHQHYNHQDDYYKILQLHQECLQKADEKVAVARQAYEMVDLVVQRLDRDLASMESLLQSMGDFDQGAIAKPNDLAACQVTPGSEWILAKVIDYDPKEHLYKLADEDVDSNKIFQLPEHQVQVLHLVEKLRPGDEVYAVYPDTTSFYQATVVQAPRKQGGGAGGSGSGSGGGGATQFCMVHFVDDSDEFGVTHDKAVPLAHVMLPPYGSN